MKPAARKQRLDEILLHEGLISEVEIQDALLRQKAHGGKFGSQLLYHRHIDEAGLVKALARQLGCEGVVLSGLEIPDAVVGLVPKRLALTRKVMPFAYDQAANVLKIACEDPTDPTLVNELSFLSSGKKVKLYVAAELALNTAIARWYLGRDVSLDDNLLLEIPDAATAAGPAVVAAELPGEGPPEDGAPAVLLVTDEAYAAPLLQSLLERDGCRVTVTDTAEHALELLYEGKFQTAWIRESLAGDEQKLTDRVRRVSPGTTIRTYAAVSSLLLGCESRSEEAGLLLKNLDLFTTLLSARRGGLPGNHSGRVGRYAEKLCRKLNVSARDRVVITNAAYVHDLAWFYGSADEALDNHQVVERTIKLLASLDYLPVVLEILRHMYLDLTEPYTDHLPLEVLGGNILTVVDLYCDSVPQDDRLSMDRVDAVKKRLRDQAGKLFLPEVVEAFIEVMQEEILDWHITRKASQAMIYADDFPLQQLLELLLKNEGYRTVAHSAPESFLELYRRSEPDLAILGVRGEPDRVMALVTTLREGGVSFERTPTFLLADASSVARLAGLREWGIEDIVALDTNLDRLINRLGSLRARVEGRAGDAKESVETTSGARGRLADMNLIDLLQALGPSRKTVRITVQPNQEGAAALVIYLDQGIISFAQLGHLAGAAAVYEGLAWADGAWMAEPVSSEDLPVPNNDLSNESILMEGCRLLDERVRAGHLL